MRDPLGEVRRAFSEQLAAAASASGVEVDPGWIRVERVPRGKPGHLGSPLPFKLAGAVGAPPPAVAADLASRIEVDMIPMAVEVTPSGGFVNLTLDLREFFSEVIGSARSGELGRGDPTGKTVVVEHTSVNPVHPLHVGSGRNAILGDSYARILRFLGHEVSARYLVNDSGRQPAVLAYGRSKVRRARPRGKPDHWYGLIYAAANIAFEMRREDLPEDRRRELEEALVDLRRRGGEVVEEVYSSILGDDDPESELTSLMRGYQEGRPDAKALFREVSESVMEGFVETLARLGVSHDAYDWESDLIWNGWVEEAARRIGEAGYLERDGEAAYVNMWRAIREREDVRRAFHLGEGDLERLEREGKLADVVPARFYLQRSDGTWLYTGTDVGYSVYKLEAVGADVVYNVIGSEQRLEQMQVRAGLALCGHDPDRLIHFSYEMVELVGAKMAGRLGRYVTVDEILDEAKKRVMEILGGRKGEVEAEDIAEAVAVGAVRYALVSVDPSKNVTFSWDRVLNLQANSGPFIQYAYTRAGGILRRAGGVPGDFDPGELKSEAEEDLLMRVAEFPSVVRSSADLMRPDLLAQYASDLAAAFNRYYETHRVLGSGGGVEAARLALVDAVRGALGSAMDLIGIPRLERM